ncbi:MAG TPA: hypothetical protein PKE65_01695 [Rhizobiaceae bacterium]|nr:hypothetical protein [Rhizobiaceae bacterium]
MKSELGETSQIMSTLPFTWRAERNSTQQIAGTYRKTVKSRFSFDAGVARN